MAIGEPPSSASAATGLFQPRSCVRPLSPAMVGAAAAPSFSREHQRWLLYLSLRPQLALAGDSRVPVFAAGTTEASIVAVRDQFPHPHQLSMSV